MTVTGNDTTVLRQFEEDGFTVVRELFGYDEIDRLCAEFAALHAAGAGRAGALRAGADG